MSNPFLGQVKPQKAVSIAKFSCPRRHGDSNRSNRQYGAVCPLLKRDRRGGKVGHSSVSVPYFP
jgi:hypothetical protein